MPDECPRMLRLPRDETTGKTQLLAQPHAAGLPGEERIRPGLDHEPVDVLRVDLSPKALGLLEQRHLGARRAPQQAKRRGEPSNPAPNNRDSHHAASTDPRIHAARVRLDRLCERLDEERIVVEHGHALEPNAERARVLSRLDVDVVHDLHVVRHEPDGNAQHMTHACVGERSEVILDRGPEPRLRAAPGGLVAPRPAAIGKSCARGHPSRRIPALRVVDVARGDDARRQAVCAEDHVHPFALRLGPDGYPVAHAPHERLEVTGRIVVARHVDELNVSVRHVQPLGDPLLIGADAHATVVRGQHQAHRVRHPIVDHARHGVLDPWLPSDACRGNTAKRCVPRRSARAATCRRVIARSGDVPPIER